MAVAFIRGLQGDDPKYIKAMACAKHFAVHSGPEPVAVLVSTPNRPNAIFMKLICRHLKPPCAKATSAA